MDDFIEDELVFLKDLYNAMFLAPERIDRELLERVHRVIRESLSERIGILQEELRSLNAKAG